MNPEIFVNHLSKHYEVHQKEPGLAGSLRAFFKRQYQTVRAVDDISFTINPAEIVGFWDPMVQARPPRLKCCQDCYIPPPGS